MRNRLKKLLPSPFLRGVRGSRQKINSYKNKRTYNQRIQNIDIDLQSERNILIVVSDSLRADHLTQAGYGRRTTPLLDSWDTISTECISAAPWTLPSVPSILTGLYPHNHGAGLSNNYRNWDKDISIRTIHDSILTISELLGAAGYSTRFQSAIKTAKLGIEGRFESSVIQNHRPAKDVIENLFNWWNSQDDPKFAYLHLGDLHQPLQIPEEQPFGEINSDISDITDWRFGEEVTPESEWKKYKNERIKLYDTLLYYTDQQLQSLLDKLESQGERDETIVVFVADHGEEMWDHHKVGRSHFDDPRDLYGIGHGHAMWQEVIQVPLAFDGLKLNPQEGWLSTVDIVPTIYEEIGASPSHELDGYPLQNDIPTSRILLSEEVAYGHEQTAVIRNNHKYIASPGNNIEFLFDLKSDPRETNVLRNDSLRNELAQEIPADKLTGDILSLDEQTRSQLEELGYLN